MKIQHKLIKVSGKNEKQSKETEKNTTNNSHLRKFY